MFNLFEWRGFYGPDERQKKISERMFKATTQKNLARKTYESLLATKIFTKRAYATRTATDTEANLVQCYIYLSKVYR